MNFFKGLTNKVFLNDLLERVLQTFVAVFGFSFLAGWAGDWSWPAIHALVLSALAGAGQAVLAVILKSVGPDKETASVLPFRPDPPIALPPVGPPPVEDIPLSPDDPMV